MIRNRIEKNWQKLRPWAERNQIEALRLYDRDIPEFPFIVDKYKEYFLIHDKSFDYIDKDKNHLPQLIQAIRDLFKPVEEHLIFKTRDRQKGLSQYEKLDTTEHFISVQESQALLLVNLWDYLDTGLFLDHRPMRQKILKESSGKKFLNLFSYTAAVSVFAAIGGATTTSVDMSATYTEWAKKNFILNNLSTSTHHFIQADVIAWLKSSSNDSAFKNSFDLIFLDPPTFSNSKKMEDAFEIEKDQDFLVFEAIKLLKNSGTLYFSNNKRKFKISEKIQNELIVKDITKDTLPKDFHDQKIHHCFQIKKAPTGAL